MKNKAERLYSDLASYRTTHVATGDVIEVSPEHQVQVAQYTNYPENNALKLPDSPANRKLLKFLDNPSVSYWLKNAIRSSLYRDSVDALNDAEQLVEILEERLAL